ncbi:LOW QUALITY PROTEIN: tripartite motif-containing protein 16-like [Cottoperca gobio]|uniref:LOW QUALITY PROTEIN: tripartite motif-containing protein 16-like n=1 Tax=Cottoperca gobio TaxID=56716 RepID=A0A6J2PT55_COTGO|nr:LOW QUALITY PROTEIN: tripartite motif-containing protein 16-like [Cottoperca gobio]
MLCCNGHTLMCPSCTLHTNTRTQLALLAAVSDLFPVQQPLLVSHKTKVKSAVLKMAKSWKEPEALSCSICFDILKSPVTLHCGHSYCMDCVNGYWDQESHRAVYSCPQCRRTFSPRPVLNKNTVLADLAGKMSQDTPAPAEDEVSAGDVECDFCTVRKLKAVKSCLVCLASYCATHLEPHYVSEAFKRHKLVEISGSIQEKICSKHDKLLEVYCRSDGQCICLLCVMDEHKGHDTVSATAERKEKQKQFGKKKLKYQQGIQKKEKQLKQLKQKMKALQCSGDAAVDQNEKAYAEIVQMADKKRCSMNELIRVQEKAAESRAEALVDRLEKDISELRNGEDELKQLSLTEDHIHFLQRCEYIFDCPEPDLSSDFDIQLHTPFDFVTKAISDLRVQMDNVAKAIAEISQTFQADSDPQTRQEFSLYSCYLSLDPNTAFENLLLSEGNRKVTWIKKAQRYPYHKDRFTTFEQVLCTAGLSGPCYWEVEWRGNRVEVAVCYKGAELKEMGFGHTNQSWCISLSISGCTFWHGGIKTKVPTECSSTVGVYLNHKAGSLSFYSVSDYGQMILLHRVHTTFSQPLYPGLMVSRGASARIVSPE